MEGISKKVFITTTVILLVIMLGSSGGIWYWMNKKTQEQLKDKNQTIDNLQKDLESKTKDVEALKARLNASSSEI